MIDRFADVLSYFENLADDLIKIKTFVYGGEDRILEMERSQVNYPALWLEPPEITGRDTGDDETESWALAVAIVDTSVKGDQISENLALSETFDIMRALIQRLQSDADVGIFGIDQNTELYPITNLNNDNETGWRLTFDLYLRKTECPPEDHFKGICPSPAIISFSWVNGTGQPFELTALAKTAPATGWALSWTYSVDDAAPTAGGAGDELIISEAGAKLYIELTATYGACIKLASATIRPGAGSGYSVPFKTP